MGSATNTTVSASCQVENCPARLRMEGSRVSRGGQRRGHSASIVGIGHKHKHGVCIHALWYKLFRRGKPGRQWGVDEWSGQSIVIERKKQARSGKGAGG